MHVPNGLMWIAKMNGNQIVLFESNDREVTIPVNLDSQTVWLTQAQMAQLFDRSIGVVSRHIKNVFAEGELEQKSNLHILQKCNSDRPTTL